MSKDFSYLRHWITGEGYPADCPSRPVILECIPSRSGASMTVYDRGERIFTVNGCNFDRIGTTLDRFLMNCFYPELLAFARKAQRHYNAGSGGFYLLKDFYGLYYRPSTDGHSREGVLLDGACGLESMSQVAGAIGLSVQVHEARASTLLLIQRRA